jgi:SAM-dependent methyltransferase
MTEAYYDELAPLYHLIYPDWSQHAAQQVAALDSLIRDTWPQAHTLLDVACGIGTQALGLAECGYQVAASDISAGAVARLEREAAARTLVLDARVADMRAVAQVWPHPFDVVIACDNAIPHLLSDEDILTALRAFLHCTRPGGGCILSVRDYAQVASEDGVRLVPRGVRMVDGQQIIMFDTWTFSGAIYEMATYMVRDDGTTPQIQCIRGGTYYCVALDTLVDLMCAAGYVQVEVVRERFFQPLVIGTKPSPDEA